MSLRKQPPKKYTVPGINSTFIPASVCRRGVAWGTDRTGRGSPSIQREQHYRFSTCTSQRQRLPTHQPTHRQDIWRGRIWCGRVGSTRTLAQRPSSILELDEPAPFISVGRLTESRPPPERERATCSFTHRKDIYKMFHGTAVSKKWSEKFARNTRGGHCKGILMEWSSSSFDQNKERGW